MSAAPLGACQRRGRAHAYAGQHRHGPTHARAAPQALPSPHRLLPLRSPALPAPARTPHLGICRHPARSRGPADYPGPPPDARANIPAEAFAPAPQAPAAARKHTLPQPAPAEHRPPLPSQAPQAIFCTLYPVPCTLHFSPRPLRPDVQARSPGAAQQPAPAAPAPVPQLSRQLSAAPQSRSTTPEG